MVSGKDVVFEYFLKRFEARIQMLKLGSVLLDTETLPATEAENFAAESEKLESSSKYGANWFNV